MSVIFVGLSGGVDSAVSAALLQEQGHNVVGCFIKIWQPEFIECTWREDRLDAMRVCAFLKIPFREIDLSNEYRDEVITDMVENYRKGATPNPDVLCNRKIKFGHFSKWAFSQGADYVATGHYARVQHRESSYLLLRGMDSEKDQSYFLWQLTQADLARVLFPVGSMTKPQVRVEAERRHLPVSRKKDSQGLCFVGDISLVEFLSRYIPLKRGTVVDMKGNTVGEHEGAALYTIGQRHGFMHGGTEPHFIQHIDIQTNSIVVTKEKSDIARSSVSVRSTRWLIKPTMPLTSDVQVRYRESASRALTEESTFLKVTFDRPRIVAPGQSLVWYDGPQLLGGGIVDV